MRDEESRMMRDEVVVIMMSLRRAGGDARGWAGRLSVFESGARGFVSASKVARTPHPTLTSYHGALM